VVDAGGPDDVPGVQDLGPADTGVVDSGPADTGLDDAGAVDTGTVDTGAVDGGPLDTGAVDAGPPDTEPLDTGAVDSGPPDTGSVDTGPEVGADTGPDVGTCPEGRVLCDGQCVALATDIAHCGGCNTACPTPANGQATCSSGVCGLACATGFADCDGMASNGCEVDTRTTSAHCGACGMACTGGSNASAVCTAGTCGLTCTAGFGDCDTMPGTGCETDTRTSVAHCGACGMACTGGANATATCAAGRCELACGTGFGNCDAMAANGCETDLRTSAQHCGACGMACATGQVCRANACVTPRTAAIAFMPAAGVVHFYSATANEVRVTLVADGGQSTTLTPVAFARDGSASLTVNGTGTLRMEGNAPFVAWLHDSSNTDHLEAAGTLDGAPLGNELYAYARSAVTVLTGGTAPSSVRVQRVLTGGAVEEIGTWSTPTAGTQRFFPVASTAGVYRITAVGAPVTAFGAALQETYNHAAYVPAESGGWVGTRFRYAEPTGANGQRRLVVQSIGASGSVTFTVNGMDTVQGLNAPLGLNAQLVAAETLITATTSTPSIAWLEAEPGNGTCDGTLSDADFVPSVGGGTYGTEWAFRTMIAPNAGCLTDRRPDIDVLAHTDGTLVEAFDFGQTTPFARQTLLRGQRLRVATDTTPNRPLRITTSEPALVQQSHANFDFLLRVPSITVFN